MRRIGIVIGICLLHVLSGSAYPQQPDAFELLLASARDAQARSDFQAAAENYRQAIRIHPEIPELSANLGLMYYQTGKDEQAVEAFRQAIRLKPGLFVPNLFLGLEYIKLKWFSEAIPLFRRAALANPVDAQVQLGLGQAYAGSGKTRLAAAAYSRATQLEPGNADAWYHLGVSYLEQVESDARILLTRHKDSPYVQLLIAETFVEQRALIQAEDAFKKVLSQPRPLAGAHALYGFVLLNRHEFASAETEINSELAANSGSLLARLGLARLHLEQAASDKSAREIEEIWKTDAGFLKVNNSLFTSGVAPSRRIELQSALQQRQAAGALPPEVPALFRDPKTNGEAKTALADPKTDQTLADKGSADGAAKSYAKGSYRECADALAPRLQQLPAKDIQLLASCAYLTGRYGYGLAAAERLVSNPVTEIQGLYWETKSAQKLAAVALVRASATDSNSPKLHVLLGDLYRQRRAFPDAEQEYRKALALRADDAGALFGLSLALLGNGQNDEAYGLVQRALKKDSDDPELNAVMGEILCARNEFSQAEPYLKKGLNTKLEYVPRVHALLGKVYAKTDRTEQAIAELKLGLPTDKDGSLHYQLARLYLSIGDRESAKQAFEATKQLQQQGLMHASVAMQQGQDESDSQ